MASARRSSRILVVGTGSIGRRHIKNLLALGADVCAYSYRGRRESVGDDASASGVRYFDSLEDALASSPEAVVVANRTSAHLQVAERAASLGCHLFIEKPLANSLSGVGELVRLATERDLVVESGFMLRLHPNLRWIKEFVAGGGLGSIHYARALVGQYLPDWRPGTDYRTSYSADGNEGGVLFDLVHELDLVGWLLGPVVEVVAMTRYSPSLEIESESIAQVGVRCIDGVLAQIQLDYLRTTFARNLEIVGSAGTLGWDYTTGTVTVVTPGGQAVVMHRVDPEFDRNDMFLQHMAHFIARLSDHALAPCASLHDAVSALRVALASHLSARERRFVAPETLVESPLADRQAPA